MSARQDIYKAHREGQDKYTYFLLAGAGAAIAFAVTQSQAAMLTWSKLPLALAVLSWAFSFYAGCRQLRDVTNVMLANYDLLRVEEGLNPQFPNDPQVVDVLRDATREMADKTGKWGMFQFRFLILGAVFYVALARDRDGVTHTRHDRPLSLVLVTIHRLSRCAESTGSGW